jgi:hypothetical protein
MDEDSGYRNCPDTFILIGGPGVAIVGRKSEPETHNARKELSHGKDQNRSEEERA